jgi:hypothetical protein
MVGKTKKSKPNALKGIFEGCKFCKGIDKCWKCRKRQSKHDERAVKCEGCKMQKHPLHALPLSLYKGHPYHTCDREYDRLSCERCEWEKKKYCTRCCNAYISEVQMYENIVKVCLFFLILVSIYVN